MKKFYRSPRRVFWTVITFWSFAAMLAMALLSGAVVGLVRAIQSLPWHG